MALIPPLPTATLFSPSLPGLDLSSFPASLEAWDALSRPQQFQLLDDAIGHLQSSHEHRALVRELKVVFQRGQNTGQMTLDEKTLQSIRMIPGPQLSLPLFPAAEETSAAQRLQAKRQRLVTYSAPGDDTSLLIRGPASLLKSPNPKPSLYERFGKIVHKLWKLPSEEARAFLQACTAGQIDEQVVQVIASTGAKAAGFEKALKKAGFHVRSAAIPPGLLPAQHPGSVESHWIVGFRSKPHTQIPTGDENLNGADLPIGELDLGGKSLHELFGRPMPEASIHKAFGTEVPGFVTRRVELAPHKDGGVSLMSEITTTEGALAARLTGWIPEPPEPDKAWIGWGHALDTSMEHMRRGIGRRAMQRILVFLRDLGLDALDMDARGQGVHFMPHIGFDFISPEDRRQALLAFAKYCRDFSLSLPPQKRLEMMALRHAWEIVNFQLDNGQQLGREFMDYYGRSCGGRLRLRFYLSPTYPGWNRLFVSRNESVPETGEAPAANHPLVEAQMRERLRFASNVLLFMSPALPAAVRKTTAHLLEAARYFEDNLEATRIAADRDALTGFYNRKVLDRINKQLERSLRYHRHSDPKDDHWVLMIDIDHFKRVNDTHGHSIGDDVIRFVTQIIRECIREDDDAIRMGGEEFCAVLRHSGVDGARRVAEKIRSRIAASPYNTRTGVDLALSVSIGAAPFRILPETPAQPPDPYQEKAEPQTSLTTTIEAADQALYRAKRSGRNRVVEAN